MNIMSSLDKRPLLMCIGERSESEISGMNEATNLTGLSWCARSERQDKRQGKREINGNTQIMAES